MRTWRDIWTWLWAIVWPPRAKEITPRNRATTHRQRPRSSDHHRLSGETPATNLIRRRVDPSGRIRKWSRLTRDGAEQNVYRIIRSLSNLRDQTRAYNREIDVAAATVRQVIRDARSNVGQQGLLENGSADRSHDEPERTRALQALREAKQQFHRHDEELQAEERVLLYGIERNTFHGHLSAATISSLRHAINVKANIREFEALQTSTRKRLHQTKANARRGLRQAGLEHFERSVRHLVGDLQQHEVGASNLKHRLTASLNAFYASAKVDADRAGAAAAPEIETDSGAAIADKPMDAAKTDAEKKHIYNGTAFKLGDARNEHNAFRTGFDEALQERLDHVATEEGHMDDESRERTEIEFTMEWLTNWSAHIKTLDRLETAFINRRDHVLELGVLDRMDQQDTSATATGSGILELDAEEEGRDIPAYGGERPDDGRVDSMADSNIEATETRANRLRPWIQSWVNDSHSSDASPHDESYQQDNPIESNDPQISPWHSTSQATRLPRQKRKLTEYRERNMRDSDR